MYRDYRCDQFNARESFFQQPSHVADLPAWFAEPNLDFCHRYGVSTTFMFEQKGERAYRMLTCDEPSHGLLQQARCDIKKCVGVFDPVERLNASSKVSGMAIHWNISGARP